MLILRILLVTAAVAVCHGATLERMYQYAKYLDAEIPAPLDPSKLQQDVCSDPRFVCKFLSPDNVVKDSILEGEEETHVEIAGTVGLPQEHMDMGAEIIRLMLAKMPTELFDALSGTGSVGLFTFDDKTTIFPEYEHLRDRPECAGTCAGPCSDTCTGDGRKWDSLAGVGGIRGTCLDDNYMCTPSDPYGKTDNILVHEYAHTIHQYALPYVPGDWWNRIYAAWQNAAANQIWEPGSYAMVNHLEYFAEGTGVFFNVNHHWSSTGGMNSCGGGQGQYCQCEEEARAWLQSQDPLLYEALAYAFSNNDDGDASGLHICMTEPNNGDCP